MVEKLMSRPEPSIFDELEQGDPEADARRSEAAEADLAAGRVVSNATVLDWLKSWGTPDRKPAPFSRRK
jgi:predicted transcriptional regulator